MRRGIQQSGPQVHVGDPGQVLAHRGDPSSRGAVIMSLLGQPGHVPAHRLRMRRQSIQAVLVREALEAAPGPVVGPQCGRGERVLAEILSHLLQLRQGPGQTSLVLLVDRLRCDRGRHCSHAHASSLWIRVRAALRLSLAGL